MFHPGERMLKVEEVHVIRHKLLVEKQSLRQVSRDTGISRNTLKKYLEITSPARTEKNPRSRPVQSIIAPRIDALLEEWGPRTTAKQRVTGSRILRQLREEGFKVGITCVRDYLREKHRQSQEVFVPLVHRPGDEAQVDFFEVTVDVNGEREKVWKFLVHPMFSNRDFARLYPSCDDVCLLDGHKRAFEFFGAVPARMVYDNMSTAVKKVLFPGRELTDRFKSVVNHYLFEPCFARVGEGHDKGGVESRGKAIRLAHLVPIPTGPSLQAINEKLLEDLEQTAATVRGKDGLTAHERFQTDREAMRPLPAAPFDPRKPVLVSVSSKAIVQVERAQYSVPSTWARLEATVFLGVDEVEIVCRDERVIFPRDRKRGKRIRYRHYLRELSRKPQAVRQVAPELVGELGEPFDRFWNLLVKTHGPLEAARVFSRVLAAVVSHGEEAVRHGLGSALAANRFDLLTLRETLTGRDIPSKIDIPAALVEYTVESAASADYDRLLAGGAP